MNKYDKIGEYFRKGCIGKEANHLEQEALSDPFLYEALEGLSGMGTEHEKIVEGLKNRIRHQVVKQDKWWMGWKWIAASVLLMGGIAVWLLNTPEQSLQIAAVCERQESMVSRTDSILSVQGEEKRQIALVAEDESLFKRNIAKGQAISYGPVKVVREPVPGEGQVQMEDGGEMLDTVKRMALAASETQVTEESGAVHALQREKEKDVLGKKKDGAAVHDLNKQITTVPMTKVDRKLEANNREKVQKNDFDSYVRDSLRYPEDARLQKIEGEVVLSVHLNKRRRVARIKVIHKLSHSCNQEAIRLVEEYRGTWDVELRDFTVIIPFSLKNAE